VKKTPPVAVTVGQECPELADIGGAAPLEWDSHHKMLRAAAEALYTLAGREIGERHARLVLLSGWLFGISGPAPWPPPAPARKGDAFP
jgi:hypothetical protein